MKVLKCKLNTTVCVAGIIIILVLSLSEGQQQHYCNNIIVASHVASDCSRHELQWLYYIAN